MQAIQSWFVSNFAIFLEGDGWLPTMLACKWSCWLHLWGRFWVAMVSNVGLLVQGLDVCECLLVSFVGVGMQLFECCAWLATAGAPFVLLGLVLALALDISMCVLSIITMGLNCMLMLLSVRCTSLLMILGMVVMALS
jgi:hypothetical protein